MSHLVRSSIATCLVAVMCTIATTLGGAIAAEDFPHHTIKIIVPVPPGPLLDVVPRIVADKLSAKWNVPVIIENRPGAAQNLVEQFVDPLRQEAYLELLHKHAGHPAACAGLQVEAALPRLSNRAGHESLRRVVGVDRHLPILPPRHQ